MMQFYIVDGNNLLHHSNGYLSFADGKQAGLVLHQFALNMRIWNSI